jgi:RNA polymerase sigma factor (sigma-70 family)
MDVFWFRVTKRGGKGGLRGNVERGRLLVLIDRDTYWQCAFLIPKGAAAEYQARGIDAIREEVAAAAPPDLDLSELDEITDLHLLTVKLDRLTCWYRPGLLAIGDAAHAMSPIGGIGINLAISHLRRQKLARYLPARLYVAPDRRDYDRAEARDVVTKALTALSPKLRAAVILHYYDGLTREEIASVLGVPAGTVASRIAKAVAIMRKATGSDQDWEPKRSSSEGALRGR